MRDTTQLHPVLQAKIKQLITLCKKKGITIIITDCYRNQEEQDSLYAQGRTAHGTIVTNTKYPNSQHNWKIAVDFALKMDIDGDGKTSDDIYNNSKKTFNKVGELAKSIGLGWGGDFKSIVDLPHLYLPDWGATTSILKNTYGTPDNFFQSWILKKEAQITCLMETYVRDAPGGSKSKYDDLPDTLKKKCIKKKDGTAVLMVDKRITVAKIEVTDAGAVYVQPKAGKWICGYSTSDGKGYHFS